MWWSAYDFFFGDNFLFTFLMIVCTIPWGKKQTNNAYNNLHLRFIDLDEFIDWLIIYAMLGQCLFFYWIGSPPPVCWTAYCCPHCGHGNASRKRQMWSPGLFPVFPIPFSLSPWAQGQQFLKSIVSFHGHDHQLQRDMLQSHSNRPCGFPLICPLLSIHTK